MRRFGMSLRKICRKCVLPENKPDLWLNDEGVCNICVDFERRKNAKRSETLSLESELIKLLNKYRGKGKYDCFVMCSGGKDSIFSLYCMKKRYKMNPLVFTFDHGFENEAAIENVRNAVNLLGVDWLYFKTDFMKDVFSFIVKSKTKAPLCHICAIWYMKLTYNFAARYKIPLIVAGWTKGQSIERGETGKEYASMSKATADFVTNCLHKNPEYKGFPRNMKEVMKASRRQFKSKVISPHWYLNRDTDRIIEVLQRELNWKAVSLSYPAGSTNCFVNFISVYLSMKNYGYTHYHIEMSKLIRLGELSREEALNMLEINFKKDLLDSILKKLGCTLKY